MKTEQRQRKYKSKATEKRVLKKIKHARNVELLKVVTKVTTKGNTNFEKNFCNACIIQKLKELVKRIISKPCFRTLKSKLVLI